LDVIPLGNQTSSAMYSDLRIMTEACTSELEAKDLETTAAKPWLQIF